ncbi:hypothetical protein AB0L68_35950 [Streptomyces sp. NPDC052164]|uniref:nSTAND1 domain-containing NTPase n=1 Tax=Streptomyces sp. NPDC052164 TaxID=3155529 RepID=UPI00343B92BE
MRCGAEQEADRTAAVSLILEHLARARLVTIDEETIELAHEALITAWPRLRAWIEEDRGGILAHRRLTDAATVWDHHERDPGTLYRGTRLAVIREWAERAGHREELTPLERDFFGESIAAEERERAVAARRTRHLRYLVAGLALLLTLATAFGAMAVNQRHRALRSQEAALSRQLAAGFREGLACRSRSADPVLPVSAQARHSGTCEGSRPRGRFRCSRCG